MINVMNTEFIATLLGIFATGIALGITIYLTNKSTQKLLERIAKVQEDTVFCMRKIAYWGKNTLRTLNCDVKENIESEEEAKKYGELLDYDAKLKCAVYKPKKSAAE